MDISAVKDYELECYITEIMLDIGVPAHLKGYHYLRDAILLSGRDMEVVRETSRPLKNCLDIPRNRAKAVPLTAST